MPVSVSEPPEAVRPPVSTGEAPPVGVPSEPAGFSALDLAAEAAGCRSNLGAGSPIPKLQPSSCFGASPYYEGGNAACTEVWCSPVWRPIQSCSPVAMSFAGGYHYRIAGDGFEADFFFAPIDNPADPTPVKENFGWVRLRLDLGVTLDASHRVGMDVELFSEEAFAAGLDVVEGTIIGTLQLDPLARGVQGPLYQPSCDFVTDDNGRVIPGPCACRFEARALSVPLYVPLGPLDGAPPDEPPVEAPIPPDAGSAP